MKIDEVTYGSGIQSLKKYLDITISTKIGTVELLDVYHMDLGNGDCYFLYDPTNRVYLSYVATDSTSNGYSHLRQIENVSGIEGSISTLMYFLTKKKNFKFFITKEEPLTREGLEWIIRTMNSGRKLFQFKNETGQDLNAKELAKEWENSRIDTTYKGKISVVIESINDIGLDIFEDKRNLGGLLMPMYRIFKDEQLD